MIKNENFRECREILQGCFPKSLMTDVKEVLDILPFSTNDVKLSDGKFYKGDNLIHSTLVTVQLDKEALNIPCRFYFNEPEQEQEVTLTDTQKAIVSCIYLRHHNGRLRESRLRKLLNNNDYWIVPFTFQLLGEYVFEILQVLDKHINDNNIDNYQKFARENPMYWQQTESRMISYWNEYYRRTRFPILKNYLGQQIVDRIKNANT
ncbi:MAG: hypothetical protein HYZ44_14560 [Bacteroidetes bacterium]|nr:hypothetical protein [Bacteroidota bacterium]